MANFKLPTCLRKQSWEEMHLISQAGQSWLCTLLLSFNLPESPWS